MPLIKRQIPALYSGVSQQPTPLRLTSQAEIEENCYANVVDGVAKRPPLQQIAVISSTALNGAYVHSINRDSNEQYQVVITNGAIKVNHVDGSSRTVNVPHGVTYLTSSAPSADFHCVTVADYTFIVNKTITVAMDALAAEQTARPTDHAWMNRGDYNGVNSRYNQYKPSVSGETYKGDVQTFANLPGQAGVSGTPAEGDLYHVLGSSTDNGFGGYYIVRHGSTWNETVKPGLVNMFDATTMPWALIRDSNGTSFTFTPFSWKQRVVGDATLNPNPSFVGRKIRDIFFYRNRLGVTADENVVFSASGDFGNFYRLTVLNLLPSEMVDLAASGTSVNLLNFAVPFYSNLMLFSDQAQFQLNVVQTLTPTTCSLDIVTKYEMSKVAKPVGIGSDVFFTSEKGNYATIWNYFVRDNVIVNTAEDITQHTPRYIPKGVIKMASSTERDMLFILTTGAQSNIYCYKVTWVQGKKVQSAWNVWKFDPGDTILNIDVISSRLYILSQRGTNVALGYVDLMPLAQPTDLTFDPLLDRRVVLTGVYSAGPNSTAFTLPYPANSTNLNIVRGGAFGALSGALIDPATYTFTGGNTVVTVPGNAAAGACYVGEVYNQKRTFSQVFQIDRDGVSIETGRFQLRTCTVYYANSAYFQTNVDTYGIGATGDQSVEALSPGNLSTFDAKTIGTAALMSGTPIFASGAYSFVIMGDSRTTLITLQNNSFVQARFVSAEFEGLYWNRATTMPG